MKLAITYTILALIATGANIAAQELAIAGFNGRFSIPFSVLAGTLTGLVLKYSLDKHFIFRYRARNALHDGKLFFLYTLMGVVTTCIFWSFEFAFQYLYATKAMRYFGAVTGLAIGYLVKYRLDKRYVFRQEPA